MSTNTGTVQNGDINDLKSEVEYREKARDINKKIFAAANIDEILIDLHDEITGLFEAERLTVYYVDGIKRELVSRFKSGPEIEEIRVPLSPSSIAGYTAYKQKLVNIRDVHDKDELKNIDVSLKFDSSWDVKSGFHSKQILCFPIVFKKMLLGAIQLVNRRDGNPFSAEDEKNVSELSETMGIGLYNQKRMSAAKVTRKTKYDHLLENHILTQKELKKIIIDSREKSVAVSTIMIKDYNVPKKDIGESLSRYFGAPYVEFNRNSSIPGELLAGLKVPFMRSNFWVPLGLEDDEVVIAINDPHDLQKSGDIKSLFPGRKIKFNIAFKDDILEYIKLFTQDEKELASIDDIISQLQDEDDDVEDDVSGLDEESSAVVQLVNKIILDANARGASDIHIIRRTRHRASCRHCSYSGRS